MAPSIAMADTFSSLPLRLFGALALAGACSLGWAQPAPVDDAKPLSKGEIKARRDFQLLDFNKDGKLSRAEVALFPRLAAAFETADTDKDGFVSFEEVEVFTRHYRAERDQAREAAAKAAQQAQEPEQK